MQHDMTEIQWWLFFCTNWITAAAYFYIPLQLYLARAVAGRFGETDTRLFEAFVFACGIHHLFHPPAMVYGWWWPAIGVDATMAAVSVWAAVELYKTGRAEQDDGKRTSP